MELISSSEEPELSLPPINNRENIDNFEDSFRQEEMKIPSEPSLNRVNNSIVNHPGLVIVPNANDNDRSEELDNNPGAYYDYYQAERRIKERRFFLWFGWVRLMYELFYLFPVFVLYIQEADKTCGTSMNAIIATEMIGRIIFFNLIRFPLLLLGKKSENCMWVYRFFVFLRFFAVFTWNLIIIVLFSISTKDCLDNATLLWVASLIMVIQAIIEFTLKIWFICLILILFAVGERDPELQQIRQMQMDRKLIVEIVTKIKNLKLKNDEFKPNEDSCCIWLEQFKPDGEVIYLPWNQKHMFHYKWISEWLSNQARCPICKDILSRKTINEALNTRRR